MKYFYYVVVKSVSDKHYAYVDKVAENRNIVKRRKKPKNWQTIGTSAIRRTALICFKGE